MSYIVDIMKEAQALGMDSEQVSKLIQEDQKSAKEKADREERAAERELKRCQLQSEEADKQRAHDKSMAELRLQNAFEGNSNSVLGNNDSLQIYEGLKLPTFNDGQDDIDSYLQRFERFAKLHKWNKEDYHVYLGSLLRGHALKVYVSLPDDTVSNYEKLKEALLRGYSVDADMYRRKFRESKCQDRETYVQLVARMEQYLERWISLSNISKDFNSLFDFLIREQLLSNCNSDMRIFLKEREFVTAVEMAESADRFRSAHLYRGKRTNQTPIFKATQSVKEGNSEMTCHGCGKVGHIRPNCPDNPRNYKSKSSSVKVNFVFETELTPKNCMRDPNGYIFDKPAEVMLDSGCSSIIVKESLIPSKYKLGKFVKVYDYLGIPNYFPQVRCLIKSKFYTGWTKAIAAPIKFADVLIGLIPGVKLPTEPYHLDDPSLPVPDKADLPPSILPNHLDAKDPSSLIHPETSSPILTPFIDNQVCTASSDVKKTEARLPVVSMAVQTRASRKRSEEIKSLSYPVMEELDLSKDSFLKAQNTCRTLQTIRDRVETGSVEKVKSRSVKYERINGMIYRVCLHSKDELELNNMQLVIPAVYRDKVLQLAHDSLTAGHFSHRKTSLKVFENFFWPGAGADIERYCKSCHICQKVSPKGRVKRVPMKTVPVIQEPFSRVAIDIVGPLSPSSDRGHRYILTLIDCATRYPEAIPLKNIDTITIAESLVDIFSRVGIPREMLSDRGTQFRSDLMSEIHRLLSIKALYTTPYHASCNGMVERLNGVLKSMLKKLCSVHPRDWDRYIPATLFAYREMPNDSLKFSPFELLYGRTVRGPLNILHELWSNNEINHEVKSTYQYVTDLRTRLEETAKLAAAKAEISSRNYKYYYDLKAKHRKLEVGDEVLVLLPTDHNKLIMQWQGPYPVVSCKDNGVDYSIKAHGKNKLFHINMLKKYHRRESISSKEKVVQVCVVEESSTENQPMYCESSITSLNDKELNVNEGLSSEQVCDVKDLITDFSDVFSDVPGHTKSIEHVIKLESNVPVSKKPFPIPHHLVLVFDKEVDRMLKLGIIEPSNSPYCSPVVLVRKSDQTWRFCIDFRGLNDITSFDCEPMPTIEDALGNFSNDVYFSELDLTKGYWQIPLSKVSKIYTAFATSRGLMQFVMMPFGLKTACATFVRLMRIVTCGLKNTDCYFDNIVVHNSNWSEHLQDLRELLNRLRLHGLTAGISKCYFGYPKIKYLGLLLGDNTLTPLDVRVKSISEMPFPNTKKELRSFLGTVGFYRKFIPNFSDTAAPLNDMLKKLSSNKLTWSDVQIDSFQSLKAKLSNNPVLCLPDYKKTFYLRTDASDNGLGAVLLQDVNDMKMPIAYASRKLLERERNYATIEKECLAIIWAVDKFKSYLFGKEFVLQTDQQPLTYLRNMKNSNGRLMRWSLILQCYSYRIEYIKGNDNIGADLLSRCPV
ncbi:uncharacterized protein [Penaeus vannamei]|uniref:uncharacterized protein n=1 Tax=Penaeus vannamei TaxID=6689 RepID=UPI00387F56C3